MRGINNFSYATVGGLYLELTSNEIKTKLILNLIVNLILQ